MEEFIQELAGLLIWMVAFAVYVTSRRKGIRGFHRFLAFWFGFPGTWISMFVVREGSQPNIEPPPDDEDALLAEVRRDRAIRAGEAESDNRTLEEGT